MIFLNDTNKLFDTLYYLEYVKWIKITLDFAGNDFFKRTKVIYCFFVFSLKKGTLKENIAGKIPSDEIEREQFEIEVS